MVETDRSSGPSTARLEAFSDGVLAIAITLLILEIRVPEVQPGGSLARSLWDLWPKYATFAVSFVTIGIMWVNHHALFDRVVRIDRRLMFLNLLLLGAICFLPFPTAVLGDYVTDPTQGHIAAALYGINMLAVGIGFLALWRHLLTHPELRAHDFEDEHVRAGLRRTIVGPIVYCVAIGLAFLSAPAALVLFAVLAVYFAVGRISRTRA